MPEHISSTLQTGTQSPRAPLAAAFAADLEYARGWHDNLASCAMDEGVGWEMANRIAARFMRSAFDVDTARKEAKADTRNVRATVLNKIAELRARAEGLEAWMREPSEQEESR